MKTTSARIVAAASKLFYDEGIRSVSMDAVAEKAGVTKRTLYYHFRSKDDLVAAYLHGRDQPTLALLEQWFAGTAGELRKRFAACSSSWLSPRGNRSGRVADFCARRRNWPTCRDIRR